jgi:signal transduction histidine kinase
VTQLQRICSAAAIILCLSFAGPAASAAEPKRVMLLQSFGQNFRPWSEYAKAIRIELNRQSPWPLDILDHLLISARFSDENAELAFVEYLRALYSERTLDLIISIGAPAAGFVQRHREQLFRNTPMLYAAVEQRRVLSSNLSENDAAVLLLHDHATFFENILRVLPATKTVAVVTGKSSAEQFWEGELRRAAKPFENRITFKWYSELSFDDILKDAAALPSRSAIVWESMSVDAARVVHEGDTALTRLHSVANAPIFTYLGGYFGPEIVGGPMHSVAEESRQTVAVALRILGGEKAADIKTPVIGFATPEFNWREMQRWGISESRLPAGSKIYFRDPNVWEQYRWQIALIFSVIFIQAALIAGLLYEHRRRQKAEAQSLQRANDLARMNRFATAGELSASIAHELRQPLTAISAAGSAGLLWLQRKVPNLRETREALESVVKESLHAGDVIKSVQGMFRHDLTARNEVNLNALVQEVVGVAAGPIRLNNIVLETHLTDTQPLVIGDAVQLQQVILNLIMNAVEAMSHTKAMRTLRLRTEVDPTGMVSFSVTDSGPPVDPKAVEKMFQPFFTTKKSGMGMGLSICKTIVEAHGGQLTAHPNNPHGMEFQITLPLCEHGQTKSLEIVDAARR